MKIGTRYDDDDDGDRLKCFQSENIRVALLLADFPVLVVCSTRKSQVQYTISISMVRSHSSRTRAFIHTAYVWMFVHITYFQSAIAAATVT